MLEPWINKMKLALLIRILLTMIMLFGVYHEAGIVTTLVIVLIALRFEIEDHLRQRNENISSSG